MAAQNPSAINDECAHTPAKKRTEFKKRVNHYLYDNLNRVLCELYFYCEHESNAIQCSEVLNILSEASLQFHQLNRQLILLSKVNMENTKSISWNVSSLSPQRIDFCTFKRSEADQERATDTKNDEHEIAKNTKDEEAKEMETSRNTEDGKHQQTILEPSQTQNKPESNPATPPKPKKIIKCWADYDSESDLESLLTDDNERPNEYEQYIRNDLQKTQSQNDESSQNITDHQNIKETEIEIEDEDEDEEKDTKEDEDTKEQKQEEEEPQEVEDKDKDKEEEDTATLAEIYTNKQQKWRKKLQENVSEKENININIKFREKEGQQKVTEELFIEEADVWLSSFNEPPTLNDIMNHQSQKELNKLENKENMKPSIRLAHNFAVPFSQMVATNNSKPKKLLYINTRKYAIANTKKLEKLIHKLSNSNRSISRNEQLQKSQLKQQKAENRRLQLREQQCNKWQIVAAKKKRKREELRKQTEVKIRLQKQELNKKLNSAKMRYEKKMKEKKLKAKQHDIKIKNAKKLKDNELSKKWEIQRKSQEEKMKNAVNRYKQTISKKKQNAKCKQLNESFKRLKEAEKEKENEKEKEKENKNNLIKKKKNNKNKLKNNHKQKHNNKQKQKGYSKESEEGQQLVINEEEMEDILNVLLKSSKEYIEGIKPKKEWIKNCHFSELKASVLSLCNKINRLLSSSMLNEIKYDDSLSFLMCISKPDQDVKDRDNALESQLQNILKLMDNRLTKDAANTYLLMHLMDNIIALVPYFNYLSTRTQRLLLQCIVNSTQKNRGIAQYIIRSESCLFLTYLLIKILSETQSSEIDSIVHTLTIGIYSIQNFPDLVDRKIMFYKYLSVLKCFNKMMLLFGRIKSKEENYPLFLRIIPFLQKVTSFNKQYTSYDLLGDNIIYDVINDTNCYGLHSLISSFVLDLNENGSHRSNSWKKKKPIIVLRIILYSFQTINNIARMNIKSFQNIIDRMHLMEFYHVLSHLLQHLTFHHNSNNKTSYYIVRLLLAQVVLFIGYCSLENKSFQECLRWGDDQNNLINKLCQLPFDYFNKPLEIEMLFPTLIAATFENKANCEILNTVLNKKHLIRFILKVYHKKYNIIDKDSKSTNPMYELGKRFPVQLWPLAVKFYKQ